MKSYKRSQRVADQIRRDVSEIVSGVTGHIAGAMVTVSGVEVSDDLRYARIFYTVLGEAEKIDEVQRVLDNAAGFVQGELARRLRIRRVPEVSLHYDRSLVEGLRVSALIDKVMSEQDGQDEDTKDDN